MLRSLDPNLTYAGADVGAVLALSFAQSSVIYGAYLGAIHGALICEAEGLRVDEFGSSLTRIWPGIRATVEEMCERIQAERYDDSQASVLAWADAAEHLLQQAHDSEINAEFPTFVARIHRKAVKAGLGSEDWAALIKSNRLIS